MLASLFHKSWIVGFRYVYSDERIINLRAGAPILQVWEECPLLYCVEKVFEILSKMSYNESITLADMNSVTAEWRVGFLPTVQGLKA